MVTRVNLFAGIPEPQIAAIVDVSRRREFTKRETVVRSSECANRFFLIRTGCVDYFTNTPSGREVLVRRLAPGEIFGFGTFFSESIGYLGTAVACRKTTALVWDRQSIHNIAQDCHKFVQNAMRIAFHYYQIYMERHARLVSESAQERLALSLVSLGARFGKTLGEGVEVLVNNERLASLADVNAYTASRTLKQWERKGVLTKSYGKILLRSPERLLSCSK